MKNKSLEVYCMDNKELFISEYEQFYYSDYNGEEIKHSKVDEKDLLGIIIKNKTEKEIENYAEKLLNGEVDLDTRVFLWKAGRLTKEDIKSEDIDQIKIVNGRGREIENAKSFIEEVKEEKVFINIDDFETAYKKILEISSQTNLKYVGAVYLITVLYFLSKKEYPIYDYFAHRAVKALYLGKNPKTVFVGAAPDKTETSKVFAMYNEYKYLLKQVFGYCSIERELDRSLWVYGHATEPFEP